MRRITIAAMIAVALTLHSVTAADYAATVKCFNDHVSEPVCGTDAECMFRSKPAKECVKNSCLKEGPFKNLCDVQSCKSGEPKVDAQLDAFSSCVKSIPETPATNTTNNNNNTEQFDTSINGVMEQCKSDCKKINSTSKLVEMCEKNCDQFSKLSGNMLSFALMMFGLLSILL